MITSFSLVQFKPFTLHKLNKRVFIFFCCQKIFLLTEPIYLYSRNLFKGDRLACAIKICLVRIDVYFIKIH